MAHAAEIIDWLAEVELDRRPGPNEVPPERDLAGTLDISSQATQEANARLRTLWEPSRTATWVAPADKSADIDIAHTLGVPTGRLYAVIGGDDENAERTREFVDLAGVHAAWLAIKEADRPGHPLAPLVAAWLTRPRSAQLRHVVVPAIMNNEKPLTRAPAWLDIASFAELEAVEVDAAPMATRIATAKSPTRRYRRKRPPAQGDLVPGPRTLAGEIVGDVVLDTLAAYPLTGDERNPLRGDIYRLGLAAFALSGAAEVSPDAGARFVGGRNTAANCKRWWNAAQALNVLSITIDPTKGEWRNLAVVDVKRDGTVILAGPAWWRGNDRWRLAGGLFRPVLLDDTSARGTQAGYWGALHRTIASFEAVLSYGPSAGRGKHGRIPDMLRPATGKAGPGPWVFVPWIDVLGRAGEHVEPKANAGKDSAEGRRWRRRRDALVSAGYEAPPGGSARAGDTVEVRPERGRRGQEAGLWIRASERFVEAARKAREDKRSWTRLPAASLFRTRD